MHPLLFIRMIFRPSKVSGKAILAHLADFAIRKGALYDFRSSYAGCGLLATPTSPSAMLEAWAVKLQQRVACSPMFH